LSSSFLRQEPMAINWFQNEAIKLQRLRSSTNNNVVQYIDYIFKNDTAYIMMEYIDGITLREHINLYMHKNQRPLSEIESATIGYHIGNGLSHVHKQGIVHRDIKPGNIMINNEKEVKIIDFGIARDTLLDRQKRGVEKGIGVVYYMAPEQIRRIYNGVDYGTVDHRTDIYSLGIILYEMATGQLPFTGTEKEVIVGQYNETPKPPSDVVRNISTQMDAIILRAMMKKKEDRYGNVDEMVETLQHLIHSL